MIKNKVLILAMLIVAIVAVGSVSAADDVAVDIDEPADDIAVDEIAIEDDSVDETDEIVETEQTTVSYDVDENTPSIQAVINTEETNSHIVSFKPIQYNLTNALTIHGNVTLYGNGATLVGSGNNIFDIAGASNFTITGFNIITNSTKAAFYGANVEDATICYNNITGGKDGINIMQTYKNINITGNRIDGVTRDAISLVDHETDGANGFDFSTWDSSIVANNIITGAASYGTEYGMFFGGNFKGNITGNVITGVATGIEFAGKKAVTNGKLCVKFNDNNITGVKNGVNMYHPNVICFNVTNCNILLSYPYAISSNYGAINTNG
ncbi:MAG: hypothetical protein Q4Q18_07835, partial [Methanobrevibacter sp.]|nr:hypothetical protein [Methanobrevibacter sp.]